MGGQTACCLVVAVVAVIAVNAVIAVIGQRAVNLLVQVDKLLAQLPALLGRHIAIRPGAALAQRKLTLSPV